MSANDDPRFVTAVRDWPDDVLARMLFPACMRRGKAGRSRVEAAAEANRRGIVPPELQRVIDAELIGTNLVDYRSTPVPSMPMPTMAEEWRQEMRSDAE